jgi:hypothetical protein
MAELRREGRVPVSTLGIRLSLAAVAILFLLPFLPKAGSSPIFRLFEEGLHDEVGRTHSSWGWIGDLALTHLAIPILGTSFLVLLIVTPLAFIQSKFFISFSRMRRRFESRDSRTASIGYGLVLCIGLGALLWFLTSQVVSIWGGLLKSSNEAAVWSVLLVTARRCVLAWSIVLLLLGGVSLIFAQFWFRLINNESEGRFRKTRE